MLRESLRATRVRAPIIPLQPPVCDCARCRSCCRQKLDFVCACTPVRYASTLSGTQDPTVPRCMLPLYYIPPDPTPTSLTRQRRRSGDPLEPAAVSGPIRDFLSKTEFCQSSVWPKSFCRARLPQPDKSVSAPRCTRRARGAAEGSFLGAGLRCVTLKPQAALLVKKA